VSGAAPDRGRTNVNARVTTGVDDFGSRLIASPLNVAVKAFLSSLTSRELWAKVGDGMKG